MIEGQRFFLQGFAANPLNERIGRLCIPAPDDLGNEALADEGIAAPEGLGRIAR